MKRTCLLLFVLLLCINTTHAQFNQYSWHILNTQGSFLPREEADLINVNGKLYLIGGRGIQNTSVFNPQTNSWTIAAKPPIELHHFQAIVYKNEIYICCGMTGGYPHEKPVSNIYIYNPKLDNWRTGAAIPANRQRGAGGAVVYQNKFYLICGILDGHWTGNIAWLDEYDPKTNQWKKLADAPVARDHFKAAVVGHKLYCMGGVQSDAMENKGLEKMINQVDVYNFNSGKWLTAKAKLPTPRAGSA